MSHVECAEYCVSLGLCVPKRAHFKMPLPAPSTHGNHTTFTSAREQGNTSCLYIGTPNLAENSVQGQDEKERCPW